MRDGGKLPIQNIPHLFPDGRHLFTLQPPPSPPPTQTDRHTPRDGQIGWGMRVDCHSHRGQREEGTVCYSLAPQVPDVTLSNDIIRTVLQLPLATNTHILTSFVFPAYYCYDHSKPVCLHCLIFNIFFDKGLAQLAN